MSVHRDVVCEAFRDEDELGKFLLGLSSPKLREASPSRSTRRCTAAAHAQIYDA